MQIIRLIADTITGNTFIPFSRYPATEKDKSAALMDYGKWANNPSYRNWRIELCEGEIIEDEPVINEIVQTWTIE